MMTLQFELKNTCQHCFNTSTLNCIKKIFWYFICFICVVKRTLKPLNIMQSNPPSQLQLLSFPPSHDIFQESSSCWTPAVLHKPTPQLLIVYHVMCLATKLILWGKPSMFRELSLSFLALLICVWHLLVIWCWQTQYLLVSHVLNL